MLPNFAKTHMSDDDEWDDLLGSGALLKRVVKEGQPRTNPDQDQTCHVSYACYVLDAETGERGDLVERVEKGVVTIGDEDFPLGGVELVIRLVNLDEEAILRLDPRFGYAEGCRPATLTDPEARLEVQLKLDHVGPVIKTLHEMNQLERNAAAGQKKEKGNGHFRAGRTVFAAKLYARAARFIKDPVDAKDAADDDGIEKLDPAMAEQAEADRVAMLISCWNNLATVQLRAGVGQHDRVWDTSKLVLALDGDNVKALYHVGLVALERNDLEAAKERLQKAAALAPKDAAVRRALKDLRARAERSKTKEQALARKMLGIKAEEPGGRPPAPKEATTSTMTSSVSLPLLVAVIVALLATAASAWLGYLS